MNLNLKDADISTNIGTFAVKKIVLFIFNKLKSILQVSLKSNNGKFLN